MRFASKWFPRMWMRDGERRCPAGVGDFGPACPDASVLVLLDLFSREDGNSPGPIKLPDLRMASAHLLG